MKNILHLTHTDIHTDSRILKEMQSILSEEKNVLGVGVKLEKGSKAKASNLYYGFEVKSVMLWSRKLTVLPKLVRHTLSLVELTCKIFFKVLGSKYDVIHCHDTLALPVAVLIKIFMGGKLVYDAHELESNKNSITPALSFLTFRTEKFLWYFIDYLIVVSPSIADWYQKKIGPKPTEVIFNSPDTSTVSIKKTDYLREYFSISPSKKVFIYIGKLGKGRGIELLCETFKNHELNSVIVFLGYGAMTTQLEELSSRYKNIYLHLAVPHEEVVTVAKSADYGMCLIENVSLSDYYCLPNKFFEYCFAGIPVISSNFPDLRNIISKFELGFYCDLNVDSIIKVVREIEIGEVQTEIDINQLHPLTWEAQSKKLNSVYNILLSEGKN